MAVTLADIKKLRDITAANVVKLSLQNVASARLLKVAYWLKLRMVLAQS